MQPEDLNLVVTEERIKDMELEVFYNVDSKSPRDTVDFVAHFVQIDGRYPEDKADAVRVILKGRKVGDIEGIMEQLIEAIEQVSVPKE